MVWRLDAIGSNFSPGFVVSRGINRRLQYWRRAIICQIFLLKPLMLFSNEELKFVYFCFPFTQNMAYQADDVTKNKILEVLGPEQLFR